MIDLFSLLSVVSPFGVAAISGIIWLVRRDLKRTHKLNEVTVWARNANHNSSLALKRLDILMRAMLANKVIENVDLNAWDEVPSD